jgi:hypothetical protein
MTFDEMLNQLQAEEVPETVYDASDKFPPRFQPGQKVRFLFKFEQDENKQVTLASNNTIVRVSFMAQALAVVTKDGEQAVAVMSNGEQPTLRFQQVDSRSFKKDDGTVVPSSLHRFFRALVGRDAARLTGTDPRLIIAKLRELDGRETFEGIIGWKLYDADSQTEYSTATRKSREYEKQDGTIGRYEPWPLVDGQVAKQVGGEFPRDFIATFVEKKITSQPVEV